MTGRLCYSVKNIKLRTLFGKKKSCSHVFEPYEIPFIQVQKTVVIASLVCVELRYGRDIWTHCSK